MRQEKKSQMSIESTARRTKQLAKGAMNLLGWWNSEEPPVPLGIAEHRASICKRCPLNQDDTLFEPLARIAAVAVKKMFEKKHLMNLKLSDERELRICSACGCELRLKVFEPLELILEQMKPKEFAALDENCWIMK